MTQYIIDTDHLTFFQHNHPLVVQKVRANGKNVKLTIITAEEQITGRFNLIIKAIPQGSRKASAPLDGLDQIR